jgi:molybdopterin-guanine dinucleotide biosynthesis protein A
LTDASARWGGVLLAGGQSTRFPGDKLALSYPGTDEPLAQRAARHLREVDLARRAWASPDAPASCPVGFDPLADSGEGPLGGLVLALEWAEAHELTGVLVLAADLPLIQPEHLRQLLEAAERHPPAAWVAARGQHGRPEPLCAVYRSSLRGEVVDAWQVGTRALRALPLDEAREVELQPCAEAPEVTASVTEGASRGATLHPCFNLNRSQDLEQFRLWFKEGRLP